MAVIVISENEIDGLYNSFVIYLFFALFCSSSLQRTYVPLVCYELYLLRRTPCDGCTVSFICDAEAQLLTWGWLLSALVGLIHSVLVQDIVIGALDTPGHSLCHNKIYIHILDRSIW